MCCGRRQAGFVIDDLSLTACIGHFCDLNRCIATDPFGRELQASIHEKIPNFSKRPAWPYVARIFKGCRTSLQDRFLVEGLAAGHAILLRLRDLP